MPLDWGHNYSITALAADANSVPNLWQCYLRQDRGMNLKFNSSGWTQFVHNQHRKKLLLFCTGHFSSEKKDKFGF